MRLGKLIAKSNVTVRAEGAWERLEVDRIVYDSRAAGENSLFFLAEITQICSFSYHL